jgi:hypothetical protein
MLVGLRRRNAIIDRIKRIDVYFGASYHNGAFLRQQEN